MCIHLCVCTHNQIHCLTPDRQAELWLIGPLHTDCMFDLCQWRDVNNVRINHVWDKYFKHMPDYLALSKFEHRSCAKLESGSIFEFRNQNIKYHDTLLQDVCNDWSMKMTIYSFCKCRYKCYNVHNSPTEILSFSQCWLLLTTVEIMTNESIIKK